MRKQNRNNRICTNEESGKTDFIIDPLLPIGKENAITKALFGCSLIWGSKGDGASYNASFFGRSQVQAVG